MKQLQLIVNNTWDRFIRIYPDLNRFDKPVVTFNKRLKTTAGRCFYWENRIDISASLYMEFKPEFILDTIPHEIAHQIDFNVNGFTPPHGPNWKKIMLSFGIEPNRCHNYIQMRANRKLIVI